ncbi:MAG: hypothetical protein HC842_03945 [Cytophagales bacterium]|nr:hypothetical protein [Cytophagales bacterium]
MNTNKISITVTLVIGILLVVNLLSDEFYFRLDFTEDNQYTLSRATRDILEDLPEPVTVKAYFSENLPPDIAKTKKDFQDLLVEYARLSDDMLVFEFINPNEKEELEQEAVQSGVQPVMINVREKDQMKQQKAFLGALVQMGERNEAIPFMQPGAAMEYALSSAIKKLSVEDKPTVAFVQGHGEAPLGEMAQVATALSVLYQTEEWTLTDSSSIPDRFEAIAMVRPTDTVPPSHLAQLDAFLSRGGKLLLAFDQVKGDLSRAYGMSQYTGLGEWLQSKGLNVEEAFLIDANCGSVSVQQQQGIFSFSTQIQFPYLPLIVNFADHPITAGLESVVLPFASPISFSGDSTVQFTALAFSSDNAGTHRAPLYFDVQKQWTEDDFPSQRLVTAAALEGQLVGSARSRLVVFGDGEFAINGERGRAQQLSPDNVNLMVNAVDWLSDDTGLIELRTKGVTSRPIEDMEDSRKAFLKYLNFLLPILLVLAYGLVRVQITRNRRIQRREESYD